MSDETPWYELYQSLGFMSSGKQLATLQAWGRLSAIDQMRGQCASCGRLGVALHGDDKCRTCWRLDNGDEEMERWDRND